MTTPLQSHLVTHILPRFILPNHPPQWHQLIAVAPDKHVQYFSLAGQAHALLLADWMYFTHDDLNGGSREAIDADYPRLRLPSQPYSFVQPRRPEFAGLVYLSYQLPDGLSLPSGSDRGNLAVIR